MITLYYCDLDILPDAALAQWLTELPAFMRPEVTRYYQVKDRKARLLARLMLLEATAKSGIEVTEKLWTTNEYGKPCIKGWEPFNISHSGNMVVLAHSPTAVGVDTEEKNGNPYPELRHIFHPREQAWIGEGYKQDERFYQLWSKKEALLKASGIGLINDLHTLNCVDNVLDYGGNTWYFDEPALRDGYTCCVCSAQPGIHASLQQYVLPVI